VLTEIIYCILKTTYAAHVGVDAGDMRALCLFWSWVFSLRKATIPYFFVPVVVDLCVEVSEPVNWMLLHHPPVSHLSGTDSVTSVYGCNIYTLLLKPFVCLWVLLRWVTFGDCFDFSEVPHFSLFFVSGGCCQVVNTLASYSAGSDFKSRPKYQSRQRGELTRF
jgi:hypothetical protein